MISITLVIMMILYDVFRENKEEEEKNTGWNDGDFMYPGSGMESVRRKKGVFFTNHCR